MYLQSLEIQGFKSFANKTVIEFHRGVTAIVGPNGCGKSNVLDSIRWVLGEQSAKALRGGEMADVIFSGTDSRQAVGMAEVSMTFAECEKELGLDYHEVRITRRVFRDGRSEYLLNKTPCRLRDIHLLFMDTGVGRSAYSIMEQGKIDQILSSRPEDRRAIFEEAAGITKYKSQKKEALRKLEFTEANLLRLTDIMKEVKRQIGSLQRQAGKAKRYQALLADLRILDTHLSRKRLDELVAETQRIEQEMRDLGERRDNAERQIAERETALAAKKDELAEMETRITDARQRVQDLRNDIASGESRIAFNRERMVEFASLAERYRVDLAAGEEKLAWQETQIVETDQQLEETSAVLAEEEAHLAGQAEAVATLRQKRVTAETSLRQTDTTLSQSEGRSNALRGELATLLGQRESAESRADALATEIGEVTARRDALAAQLATAREQQTLANTRLSDQREALRRLEEALKTAQTALQNAERALTEALRGVTGQESRLAVLRQLNEEGAGLGGGTQAVLKGLDQPAFYKPALLGSLASQIETEPAYITAIESALGAHLQTVLLQETELAGKIFEVLVAKKQGRAALAPLPFFEMLPEVPREFLPDGALAWALDKITVSGPARLLVHRLLQHTVIVATLDDALRLKPLHPTLTFALPDGTLLTAEGVIQGGQTSDAGNSVLARRNQITALEATLETARQVQAEAEKQRATCAEALETLRGELQLGRDQVQEAHLTASSLQSQVANLERETREIENKLRNLEWERGNLEKRRETAASSIAQNELQLAELAALITTHQARRGELQAQLDQARDEENQLSETLNEARVRVATERQRQENLRRQRQPMSARVQELRDLIAQRKNDITAYTERTGTLEIEIDGITERIGKARGSLGSAEEVVAELIAERGQIAGEIEKLENSTRQFRRDLQQCQEESGRREVRQTQLQLRVENVVEHVQRRYQVDLRGFQPDTYAFSVAVRDLQQKRSGVAPAADSFVSAATSSAPAADSFVSAATSSAPAATSFVSAATSSAPAATSSVPAATSSVPAATSSVPAATSSTSAATSSAPAATSSASAATSSASAATSSVPAATSSAPADASFDWAFVESAVAEMTERVDAIGPVNLDAIQEYDELEERQKFLDEQNNDLTKSKAELLDVIAKINHTTKQLFADTFEQVRVNFQEMFTELFGGGKANLLLQDDSDPLECGIEIIAKPPGKQLQSITLLSGGEKTMTAVALLFSIYMVKPSPFCVLDEMDAPLDESNINRFIKILDRFVAQSQFVVITHNKRTIAKADILYGVTMEEHGVSKLVGVKLTKRGESDGTRELEASSATEAGASVPSIAETFGKHGNLHSETALPG